MELRRRQHLLQIIVQDFRQALTLAVLGLGHLQRQLLELLRPVLQFRRSLGDPALQRRVQVAQRLLRLLSLGDVLDEDDEILRPARLVSLDRAASD